MISFDSNVFMAFCWHAVPHWCRWTLLFFHHTLRNINAVLLDQAVHQFGANKQMPDFKHSFNSRPRSIFDGLKECDASLNFTPSLGCALERWHIECSGQLNPISQLDWRHFWADYAPCAPLKALLFVVLAFCSSDPSFYVQPAFWGAFW